MTKFGRAFVATFITLAIACSASSWAQQSLRAAGQDVPPWVVHDKGSSALSGIAVDLMTAIAKDAGLQVQYQLMTLGDLIPALASSKIDVIATNMAMTPERKQQVDFSNPIYNAPTEAVVVLASDTTAYRTLTDFKGLPVGAAKGTIQLVLLEKTGGFSQIKVYDTEKDAWGAVASGAIKAAVTAGSTSMYAAKQGELANLRIVGSYQSPSSRPQVGLAVKKGNNELLGKINNSLARLEADGTIKVIFSKYGLDDWVSPKARAVEVVDLPSASGGTQHVLYDAPLNPTAVAIMFIGGNGVVPFEADGSLRGGRSTLVRTRQLWIDKGVAVLIPGKPNSVGADALSYRLADAYADDVRALVAFARTRTSAPIWLLGHSLGTVAVASAASRFTHQEIAGVVFAAPTVNHIPPNITESVFDAPLALINVPALVVAHEQDGCRTSASDGPARLRAALTGASVTELFLFSGGEPSGGPCDPTALHSFVGLDAEFVSRVAAWMQRE